MLQAIIDGNGSKEKGSKEKVTFRFFTFPLLFCDRPPRPKSVCKCERILKDGRAPLTIHTMSFDIDAAHRRSVVRL